MDKSAIRVTLVMEGSEMDVEIECCMGGVTGFVGGDMCVFNSDIFDSEKNPSGYEDGRQERLC